MLGSGACITVHLGSHVWCCLSICPPQGGLHNQQPQAGYDIELAQIFLQVPWLKSLPLTQTRTPILSHRVGKFRDHSGFLSNQSLAKVFQTYLLGPFKGQSHEFKEEDPSGPFLRPYTTTPPLVMKLDNLSSFLKSYRENWPGSDVSQARKQGSQLSAFLGQLEMTKCLQLDCIV